MRATFLFLLTIVILILNIWAWTINPLGLEYFSREERNFTHDQLDKIRGLTDVESLRAEAINQLYRLDEKKLQRDAATTKVQTLLTVIVGLEIVMLSVLFYEIASRGRDFRE